MAKNQRIAGNPEIDPTLPKIAIKLGNETYFLCFTFGALAMAEKNLRSVGIECNMLHALELSSTDAQRLVPVLYAALISHQPKITIDKVTSLVTIKNLGNIFEGIAKAYAASLAEPSADDVKPDPDQPAV
jgi:hypothetical protein